MHTKYHFDNNFTVIPKKLEKLILYQLGEMLCDPTTVVEPHVHLNWFEFTYVLQGKGTIYTNDIAQEVQKNELYVSFPQEIHKIESDNLDPLRYCFFAFHFSDAEWAHDIIDSLLQFKNPNARVITSPHYEKYLVNALNYINNLDSPLMEKLLEHELMTLIIRVAHDAHSVIQNYHPPKINNQQLLSFNIANYIDINLTTIDNITSLSEIFNYNYSYLSRCFKKTTQISISQYYNDKKLHMAAQLLATHSMPVSEIAEQLNYTSIYVFSRAFKNKYHISPTDYRNSLLNPTSNSKHNR